MWSSGDQIQVSYKQVPYLLYYYSGLLPSIGGLPDFIKPVIQPFKLDLQSAGLQILSGFLLGELPSGAEVRKGGREGGEMQIIQPLPAFNETETLEGGAQSRA